MKHIKATWFDLVDFLRNPKDKEYPIQKTGFKIKRLFSILVLGYLLMMPLAAIIYGVEQTGLIDTESHALMDLIQSFSPWVVLLLGALIVPFIEELFFRLPLRLKHNYPVRFLFLVARIIGKKNSDNIKIYSEAKWHKYYKAIFYSTAIIFALVHISNFENLSTIWMFTPLLVAPQFLFGLLLGYLRVKFGFLWGCYLHSLHNLIILSFALAFLSSESSFESVDITNKDYTIKIEENGIGGSTINSSSHESCDSVSFENFKLKPLIAKLLDKKEILIKFSPKEKSNQRINLVFKKHSSDLQSNQVILDEVQKAYDFVIAKNNVLQKAWVLQILDTTLLLQHKSDSSSHSTINTSDKEIEMQNANLNALVKTLDSKYKEHLISDIDLQDCFNFEFQREGFSELEKALKNEYGLLLKMTEREVEFVRIDFEKKDKKGS